MLNSSKEIINKARKDILVRRSPDDAINLLLESDDILQKEEDSKEGKFYKNLYKVTLALAYQEKKDYIKAYELYSECGEKYQAGFCQLLLGNKLEAERLWYSCPTSPAVEWGKCLLDFINLRHRPKVPSYLQIRNFLEMDINYFIHADKIKYAENVMKNEDLFISVNLESYKLFGRVLLAHGFLNQAKKFLLKSVRIIDQDSETFYYLGLHSYAAGDYQECIRMLKRCLELNVYYVPATELLHKVHLKIAAG